MSTLSINPSFSPSFCASCSSDTPSSSSSSNSQPPFKVSSFCPPRPQQPIGLACTQSQFLLSKRPKSWGLTQSSAKDMTITDFKDDEESPPLMVESEVISRPRRIALFVEPSPFAYVSGYKNRFQNFIRYLREMGDEVNSRGSDSVEVNDCSRDDYPPLVVDLSDNSASDCAAVEEIRVPTRRSLRNQEVLGTLISDRIDRTANNTGKNMPWKRRRNPILEETAVTEGASFFEEPPTWSKHNAETTDFE